LRSFSDVEGFGDEESSTKTERVAWSLESSEDKQSLVKGSVVEFAHSWFLVDSSRSSDTENYNIKFLLWSFKVTLAPLDSLKCLQFRELQAPLVLRPNVSLSPLKLLAFVVGPLSKLCAVVFLMLGDSELSVLSPSDGSGSSIPGENLVLISWVEGLGDNWSNFIQFWSVSIETDCISWSGSTSEDEHSVVVSIHLSCLSNCMSLCHLNDILLIWGGKAVSPDHGLSISS